MIDKNKVLIGLGQHINGSFWDRCTDCPYHGMDGFICRDALMADLHEMLESQEPHVLTFEDACGRDYCFYEYRATGFIEPASVVMSGAKYNGEPLVDVYRLGREGAAYVEAKDYGHEWRCWDRMPEDGQKEGEPWN